MVLGTRSRRSTDSLYDGDTSDEEALFLAEKHLEIQRRSRGLVKCLPRFIATPLSHLTSSTIGTPLILYLVGNVAYVASLKGASSPKEMNGRLGLLGLLLATAAVAFSFQFWLVTLSSRISRLKAVGNVALQVATLLLWYLYDNGNRLESHGSYNLLIFTIMFVPTNILFGILYFWYTLAAGSSQPRRPKRFWIQFVLTICLLAFVIRHVALSKQAQLSLGFFDKKIPCSSDERNAGICDTCTWDDATPWFDLLPFRLNFFTGPMTCPMDNSFSARFERDQLIVENCDVRSTKIPSSYNDSAIYEFTGAAYTLLPRTEDWGLTFKQDSLGSEYNTFQQSVIDYAERETYAYEGPAQIDPKIDAVFVHCGDMPPKLVYRINERAVAQTTFPELDSPGDDGLNVITIFVDAVSRRQFHRRLPETRRVLEELTGPSANNGLFEFFRYHTVGLNTGPNTRALWAGLDEKDEEVTGKPIWEQFQRAGYVSARIDPMCQDWKAYYDREVVPNRTYVQPRIDHEHVSWSCFPPYLPFGKHWSGNFAGSTSIKARCISDTHVGWHELDWAHEYIHKYRYETPRAYYINAAFMEGHEGSGEVLRTLDDRLARFLDPRTSPIDHSNTAIVILSDHGALMGLNNAFFENGKIEAANPVAIMMLPNEYTAKLDRLQNLQQATGRLVTAHDLYETTRGFMTVYKNETETRRGIDLAKTALPDRSCTDAGITETKCRCN